MRRLFSLVALVLVAACGELTGLRPAPIAGARPFSDTALLTTLWTQTEACSGISGDLSAVSFFIAPATSIPDGFWGYWYRSGNRVVISEVYATDRKLIEHEMMHALLQDGMHPAKYFDGVCGDLSYPNETLN